METAILTLLEQNNSLGFEQIALYLDEPPEQVRSALTALRRRRLVDVLGVSEVVGHTTAACRLLAADRARPNRARSFAFALTKRAKVEPHRPVGESPSRCSCSSWPTASSRGR